MKHERNKVLYITRFNWSRWYDLNPFRFPKKVRKEHSHNNRAGKDPSPNYAGTNEYFPEDYGRQVE